MPYIVNNVRIFGNYVTNTHYMELYLWQSTNLWKHIMFTKNLEGIEPEGDTIVSEHCDTIEKGVEEMLKRFDCNMPNKYKIMYINSPLAEYNKMLYNKAAEEINKVIEAEKGVMLM